MVTFQDVHIYYSHTNMYMFYTIQLLMNKQPIVMSYLPISHLRSTTKGGKKNHNSFNTKKKNGRSYLVTICIRFNCDTYLQLKV